MQRVARFKVLRWDNGGEFKSFWYVFQAVCENDKVLKDFGLGKSESDHNMYCSIHSSLQVIVILYGDDLLLTGDDEPKLNLLRTI